MLTEDNKFSYFVFGKRMIQGEATLIDGTLLTYIANYIQNMRKHFLS